MKKFWSIVKYEYTRHVLRRRFIFGLLSVPLMIAIIVLITFLLIRSETNDKPVGYVDHSGLLANPIPPPRPDPPDRPVKMLPFATQAQAEEALKAKQIQAYFVLEPDYLQTSQVKMVALKEPSSSAKDQFESFLRVNLLAGQPAAIIQRISQGNNLVVRSADGSRQMAENDWVNFLVPILTGLAFMIAVFTTSGYLMQAVVEEKENRTMEVVITSVSPSQLMSGKIIGVIGVGMTQLLAWIGVVVIGVLIGRNYFTWMQGLQMAPGSIALLVATFIPAFVMIAALMAAVGATVTEAREGQQITGLFTLPIVLPYWFTYQIMNNPNGPLSVGLSFFPLTAPVTLTMRIGFVSIPTWQIALNLAILVFSALAALWLAGRTFRLGMLQYGKRLSLRQIFGRSG